MESNNGTLSVGKQQQHHQTVKFGSSAHAELLKGATILADAVKTTMGPSGHSVIIDSHHGGSPLITKDGVTVAKSINLKDRLQSMGAELIKEVASKTNELAGDGTSSSTVLAHSMLAAGIKSTSTGRSSIAIKRGMDIGTETVLKFLKDSAIPVSCKQDIINVATISANGDKVIGSLIADAIEKVGQDGIITVEPAKSITTSLHTVEGLQLDSGYLSPFFVTNSDKANCEFENPWIVITANKISSIQEILPILEKCVENKKSLILIADDVEGEALHTLIVNKMKERIKVCAIKAPSFGEHRADLLEDLATVVGTEVIGATSDLKLEKMRTNNFGTCAKVIVNRTNTIFVGNASSEQSERTKERIEALRSVLMTDNSLDEGRQARYKQRLAKLSGGVAVIKVGGSTEIEIREKKDRVDDAVNATVAATQEGIVPGGGTILLYASQYLKEYLKHEKITQVLNDDELAGIKIIAEACEMPFRTIISNTGRSPDVLANEVINNLLNKGKYFVDNKHKIYEWKIPEELSIFFIDNNKDKLRFGINAINGEYTDLIKEGIIDPCKVERLALEHACSVVSLVLTCNSIIVNETEEKEI